MAEKTRETRRISDVIEAILRPPLPYVVTSKYTDEGRDSRIIVLSDPTSYLCEQYGKVVTNLEFLASNKQLKTFLITSPARFEGKSITVSNIASIISRNENKKVLLLDLDLRKSTLHRLFNLMPQPGITDLLLKHLSLDKVMHNLKDIPNLHIITSGSNIASPLELLTSDNFKNQMEEFKSQFDYIFLDTPPLLAVADPCVLAKIVDGVIVSVGADITPEPALRRGLAMLEDVKANVVGLLLTHTLTEYHCYYYGKYYRSYKCYSDNSQSRQEKEK